MFVNQIVCNSCKKPLDPNNGEVAIYGDGEGNLSCLLEHIDKEVQHYCRTCMERI